MLPMLNFILPLNCCVLWVLPVLDRQKNEPPLDKGFLPWLGHALEFGKDAAKFLTRMKEKHGDIFTVCVAGHYVTVLLDPNSYDSVLYDTKSLDFTRYKNQIIKRVFNAVFIWHSRRHFHGLNLSKLSSSMKTHLQTLLMDDQKDTRKDCHGLGASAGFQSTGNMLHTRGDDATAVYTEFRKFDGLLSKMARCTLKRGKHACMHRHRPSCLSLSFCSDFLTLHTLHSIGSEVGCWQQSYQCYLQEEGVDAEMQKRALLLQLWATQGNAGPAAFWLLGFLLTHPEAMKAVKAEIRGLAPQDSSLQQPPLNKLETHSTPVFDSVLSETLRLTAAVIITREVVQDKTLHMANGQNYHLRRGDRVCLFPFLSPQMDPQIHQEPQKFKFDRFLNDDMTEKNTFYKDGKRVKYHSMPWGAGTNVCVGKEFAIRGIKQFVFLVLTHLDLEICDPQAKVPPVNPSRYGFGMLQPDGDLQVRYRLKRTWH
uniref:Prostacyclin synthase n=1 Tax=Myripristis murdjan TaxID=586833 RepID=A0A667YR65_9TELE